MTCPFMLLCWDMLMLLNPALAHKFRTAIAAKGNKNQRLGMRIHRPCPAIEKVSKVSSWGPRHSVVRLQPEQIFPALSPLNEYLLTSDPPTFRLSIPKQKKGLMFDLWCRTLARTTVAAEAFFTNRSVERLKTTLHLVVDRSAFIKISYICQSACWPCVRLCESEIFWCYQ